MHCLGGSLKPEGLGDGPKLNSRLPRTQLLFMNRISFRLEIAQKRFCAYNWRENAKENENILCQPGQFAGQNSTRREPAPALARQGRNKRLQASYKRALLFFAERPKWRTAVRYVGRPVQGR